ncbi:MupA/Atu3671 family FMN-dependent luciferase-like monooxygenase [Nocardia lijiangensis]|uniref:MupA/Atu3671 family FMN-dependent luciferase-like monooxygenase n=1 Tax=Nocardia lijiangensis TaxID=299618 RepID=UPI003D707095
MDLSLFFFASNSADAKANYQLLLDATKFADQRGFTAIWTPERHFHAFGGAYPNPSVTSAALATVTSRIQLRAGSVVAPLHDPLRVAEEWSIVDNLSNGRVGVAFASGWHADDFVFKPDSYENRRAATIEAIETVRSLWRGDPIRRTGGGGTSTAVALAPAPVQTELPMWLTSAGSEETFRQAGIHGLGVLTHLLGQNIPSLGKRIAEYRRHYAESQGDTAGSRVALMVHTFVDRDAEYARKIARDPFADYLTSSFDLLSRLRTEDGASATEVLSEADVRALIDRAVDRYMNTSGIFGSPRDAIEVIDSLRDAGVDEIACLIDFGLPHPVVMGGLEYLAGIRRLIR